MYNAIPSLAVSKITVFMSFINHDFYTHEFKTLHLLLMKILNNSEGKHYLFKSLKEL